MIGQRLGQYEIVALLGEGGMASVYRAHQPSMNRDVAIKVIKPALAQGDDFVRRFDREVRTIATLSHPHILKIYDYGQQDDALFFVMELLTGGSLAQLLNHQPLESRRAITILEQLGSALDYAHEMNIIHRDLKPQNVLLDGKGHAFLADFGIAHWLEDTSTALTQSGATLGTPAYMAPEQWRSEGSDTRTDLYAFGVMAFEMLCGSLPFKADSPYGMMHAHLNLAPPPPHAIRAELPAKLAGVFAKALAKDRDSRFTSAMDLVEALRQAFDARSEDRQEGNTVSGKLDLTPTTRSGNPFFNRSAIRDRAYFVNRDDEVRQVLSLLKNGQSVSIVGQRRIGKTSLLFHVTAPEVFTHYGLAAKDQFFVYLDCGSLAELTPQGIYRALLEEIYDAARQQDRNLETPAVLRSEEPISYRALERSLRDWLKPGQQLTFVLDEFERLSRNPALDPDFFSGLRALATRHTIAFVTASKQPLLALTYADSSTLSSPFFNIFALIRLQLFSDESARTLIDQLLSLAGLSLAEPTIAAILALGGTHPLFLQIAAYEAIELQQAKGDTLQEDDLAELEGRFLAAVEQHFAYYWRDLTDAEQQLLATLPAAGNSDLETLRALEQKSLIVRRGDHYDYLSAAFQAFVQGQDVPGLIQAAPIVIDGRKRRVLLDGQTLGLTELQYALLAYLAERPDEVVTNEELERAIWGDEYVDDPERLKSVVKGLRRALDAEADRLENVRGVGYLWRISP